MWAECPSPFGGSHCTVSAAALCTAPEHPLLPTAQPRLACCGLWLGLAAELNAFPFPSAFLRISGCCLACLCCAAEALVASCGFGPEPIAAWQAVSSVLAGHERHPTETQAAEFDRKGRLADQLVSNKPGGADVASDITDIGSLIPRATSPRTQRAHEIGRGFSEAIADEACNELQQPSAARAFAKWVSNCRELHELGVAQPQCRYGS